ncbi:hypothetical protein [Qipengyuania mesophila]|uniref:hypothetical protein n=1 Tax=Qipengyuania mesophila TaxID=2867246 RepID=UPI003512E37B
MRELDDQKWTLEDHLLEGRSVIKSISDGFSGEMPRVCFHFYPIEDGYDEAWGMEADYCQLAKREFDKFGEDFDVDYVGGWSGVEAWQKVLPTEEWLEKTFPLMWELAGRTKLIVDGWTFEPFGGPIISSCDSTSVFNRGDLEEPLPESASGSFDGLKSWLERSIRPLKKPEA